MELRTRLVDDFDDDVDCERGEAIEALVGSNTLFREKPLEEPAMRSDSPFSNTVSSLKCYRIPSNKGLRRREIQGIF